MGSKIAEVCEKEGIEGFAVATLLEALSLRNSGIQGSILILGAPLPSEFPTYVKYSLDLMISSPDICRKLVEQNLKVRAHMMINTGMNRIGVKPQDAVEIIPNLLQSDVELINICTHMADPGEYTTRQLSLTMLNHVIPKYPGKRSLGVGQVIY